MLGPIETWVVVGVFMTVGAKESIKINTETRCHEYKHYLMELWVADEESMQIGSMDETLLIKPLRHAELEEVYMMRCKNATTNRRS